MEIHSLAATTWQNMLQALQGMIDTAAAHADADTMMDARLALRNTLVGLVALSMLHLNYRL